MSGRGSSSGGSPADFGLGKVVVVAVKAAPKEIPTRALVWALTHVIQPGDCIRLLVILPLHSPGKRVWGFSRFTGGDCSAGNKKLSFSASMLNQRDEVSELCSQMMNRLRDAYDIDKIRFRVKVVSDSTTGVVAAEAKNSESNWVILDKHLKHEKKCCLEKLDCNLVVMKKSRPKVLRLKVNGSLKLEPEVVSFPWPLQTPPRTYFDSKDYNDTLRGPFVTPASSPEHEFSMTTTDIGTGSSSRSSSEPGASPFLMRANFSNLKNNPSFVAQSRYDSDSDTDATEISTPHLRRSYQRSWMDDASGEIRKHVLRGLDTDGDDTCLSSAYKNLLTSLSRLDNDSESVALASFNSPIDVRLSKSVREAISLSGNVPLGPPPLCSMCKHKAPGFGSPPKWFAYGELEAATKGFSKENFLAEGGFGSVYRGVLQDGRVVAVKQHKSVSSQGDVEFCSEVEVLSCAQHRNVVMLIGFCVEGGRRLLVYEYICNGSLDSHLFALNKDPLTWAARQKIAVGAARGLRYLHEECRVGCIVHRDMRPNNILVTHDFEPMVGDFGLARWQPQADLGVSTRIIGTFGYLAPEYVQSGRITEKADVYAFGVVLLELVTGRKAIDVGKPKGQQCLTEWARPLLEKKATIELVDPRLNNCYLEPQLSNMMQCALLCLQRDPDFRPRMSQVLRMLEGEMVMNSPSQT
ncbi:unnamed protein product [Linum tenue]|uniref:Protein kinase domain-containing protein n=2 Tax=Linum tenue TaxID=586396 RepID=A0AAV0QHR4_9ROSI|nr:unnamed protein product [Linum tenue]